MSSSCGTISIGVLGQDSLVSPFLHQLHHLGNDASVANIRALDSVSHQELRKRQCLVPISSSCNFPDANRYSAESLVELFFSPITVTDPSIIETVVDISSPSAMSGHLIRLLKLDIKATVDESIAMFNDGGVDGIVGIVDSSAKDTLYDVIYFLRRLCSVHRHLPVLIIDVSEDVGDKSDAERLQDLIMKVPFSKGRPGLQFAGVITLCKIGCTPIGTSRKEKDEEDDNNVSRAKSEHTDFAESILKKLDEKNEGTCTDTSFARIISLLPFTRVNTVLDACLEIVLFPRHLLWDNDTESLHEEIIPQLKRCFEIITRDSADHSLHYKELAVVISLLFGVASVDDVQATKKVIKTLLSGDDQSYETDDDDDSDTIGVYFDGFLVFLHSLVSQRRHRAVWDLLTHYGHHPVTGGACWSIQDLRRADDAFSRTDFDIRTNSGEDWWWTHHRLNNTRNSTLSIVEDSVTHTMNILPMPTVAIQCTLSKTAAVFLKGLYSSESRYSSFEELWTQLPSEISKCPWDGIIGLPTLSHSVELAERRRERKDASEDRHISYMAESQRVYSENSLESVYRFIECFQLAASLSVSNENIRHHIIQLTRWWGYKGSTDQLFSFRPSREYRHGTKEEDGGNAPVSAFAVVIHVLVCGPRQCGKSDMVHFTRFDKDVIAQGRDGEEEENDAEDDSNDVMLQRTPPNCTSVRAVTLSDVNYPSSITTIFYHEISTEDQEHIFNLRTILRGMLSTSGNISFPSLDTIDVCILAFDGSDPYSFSYFTQIFRDASCCGVGIPPNPDAHIRKHRAPSQPIRLSISEWIRGKRLPLVPVLLKGDEKPAEQIINVHLPDSHGNSTVSGVEHSSITSVEYFCEYYGLQWPPILTSSADDCMWSSDIPNEIEDLNRLMMGVASSPSALIGQRINIKEQKMEEIIEKTAVVVRRTIILASGVVVGCIILAKIVGALRGKPKK